MSLLKNSLIQKVVGLLPGAWCRALRRIYYIRIVRNYTEDKWEWSGVVKPMISPGTQVLDIGANVGYLSGLFARWAGPEGRVVSVEPIPATYDVLSASMKKLYPQTATAIQCCVSDQAGDVTMSVPDYEDGGRNYYESHIVTQEEDNPADASFQVKAVTLDEIIKQQDLTPGFIKIDVEGHELSVIRGGAEFLTQKKPPLLIEVSGSPDDQSSTAYSLFNELSNYGYKAHTLEHDAIRPRKTGDVEVDYLFLSQSD